MDNRAHARHDLMHRILKYARFAAVCVVSLCLKGSSDEVEHHTVSQNASNYNTSVIVSNEDASDNSTTAIDYWELKNQRGVSRNQILSFRKIGSKGKTAGSSVLLL